MDGKYIAAPRRKASCAKPMDPCNKDSRHRGRYAVCRGGVNRDRSPLPHSPPSDSNNAWRSGRWIRLSVLSTEMIKPYISKPGALVSSFVDTSRRCVCVSTPRPMIGRPHIPWLCGALIALCSDTTHAILQMCDFCSDRKILGA